MNIVHRHIKGYNTQNNSGTSPARAVQANLATDTVLIIYKSNPDRTYSIDILPTLHSTGKKLAIRTDHTTMAHPRSDPELGEKEWIDSDGSDIELYQHPEKGSFKRKRFLVLAAVVLSRAGSEGRKRPRTNLVAHYDSFKILPREIRDMIYEYMTVPPLEHRADQIRGRSMSPLAQTCSQGLLDGREECQRHFYRILKDVEEFYLR